MYAIRSYYGQLVGREVVAQPFRVDVGELADILDMGVEVVVGQYGDDLVVRLAMIDHLQPPHDLGGDEDFGLADRAFADHADIERVSYNFV